MRTIRDVGPNGWSEIRRRVATVLARRM